MSGGGRLGHVLGAELAGEVPFLRVSFREGAPPERVEVGPVLRWQVTAERRCPGYPGPAGRVPCPARAQVGRQPCPACQARDPWRACLRCPGHPCPPVDPELRARCDAPHWLYLATFGDGRVKAGTAVLERGRDRPVEQGPVAAIRVARGPGPWIKRLESVLVAGGLVEAVTSATKLTWRQTRVSAEEARRTLDQAWAPWPDRLSPELRGWLIPPEAVELPRAAEEARRLPGEVLRVEPGVWVLGQRRGQVGSLVVLQDGHAWWVLDLGELRYRVLDFAPRSAPVRPAHQLGLFGRPP